MLLLRAIVAVVVVEFVRLIYIVSIYMAIGITYIIFVFCILIVYFPALGLT